MVENRTSILELVSAQTTQTLRSNGNRCIVDWLGCLYTNTRNQRALGQIHGNNAVQFRRTGSSVSRVKVLQISSTRKISDCSIRQYITTCAYLNHLGDRFKSVIDKVSPSRMGSCVQHRHKSQGSLLPRKIEHTSRQSIKDENTVRMETTSKSVSSHKLNIWLSHYRQVCIVLNSSTAKIQLPFIRPRNRGNRRTVTNQLETGV